MSDATKRAGSASRDWQARNVLDLLAKTSRGAVSLRPFMLLNLVYEALHRPAGTRLLIDAADGQQAVLDIANGRIAAWTAAAERELATVLDRVGIVTNAQLRDFEASGDPLLAPYLLGHNLTSPRDVEAPIQTVTTSVIWDLLSWEQGTVRGREAGEYAAFVGTPLEPEAFVFAGVREMFTFERGREFFEQLGWRLSARSRKALPWDRVNIDTAQEELLSRFDDGQDARALLFSGTVDPIEASRTLIACCIVGVLQPQSSFPQSPLFGLLELTDLDRGGKTGDAEAQLGLALYDVGEFRKAGEHSQRAIEAEPENPLAHLVLANVFQRVGDPRGALHEFDRYIELVPHGVETEEARRIAELIASLTT